MEFAFELLDIRVSAINVMLQMTVKDYSRFVIPTMEKNPFQRKQLAKRDRTYLILRNDLIKGCIMPPISLATSLDFRKKNKPWIDKIVSQGRILEKDRPIIRSKSKDAIINKDIMILDGLQRTIALKKAVNDSKGLQKSRLLKRELRLELYIGLTETGLLYRMLTLNTGQTPMTLRHQIEIVFSDYLDSSLFPKDINIISEAKKGSINRVGKYRLADVIGLFHAYITRSPAPMTKSTILSRLAPMDFMETYDRDLEENLHPIFEIYHRFVESIDRRVPSWCLEKDSPLERPFGKTILRLFSRSQPMAGFGSACIKLLDTGTFPSIDDMTRLLSVSRLQLDKKLVDKGLVSLNESMDEITQRGYSSKIGTMQRAFFEAYFEDVLYSWSRGSLDLVKSAHLSLDKMKQKFPGLFMK